MGDTIWWRLILACLSLKFISLMLLLLIYLRTLLYFFLPRPPDFLRLSSYFLSSFRILTTWLIFQHSPISMLMLVNVFVTSVVGGRRSLNALLAGSQKILLKILINRINVRRMDKATCTKMSEMNFNKVDSRAFIGWWGYRNQTVKPRERERERERESFFFGYFDSVRVSSPW